MSTLGMRLRKLRVARALSAEEVARRLNIAPSTYREWENGRAIMGEPYVQLSMIFGVSLSELLGASDDRLNEIIRELSKVEDALKRVRSLL